MICRFIPKIDFETIRNTSTRFYEVRHGKNLMATMWVKDLHVFGFGNKPDRYGELWYNNNAYHIDPNMRYGYEWYFFDKFNNKIMSVLSTYEDVMVEKKKLFSKEKCLKKRGIDFERIIANDRVFKVYTVNLGVNGQHYVIKEGEKTVSIIHIHDKQEFYSHEMDLYMEDDDTVILLTFLYCFAVNMYQYYHTDETLIHGDGFGADIWSKSKPYILEKFDPEFIERIKKQEEKNINEK